MDIYEKHGSLTPPLVVVESKPKKAYLHNRFEWDNDICGDRYREQQARQIINVLKFDVQTADGKKAETAVFVSVVNVDGEQGYVPVDVAIQDVPAWEYAINDAFMMLMAAEKRVKGLVAFAQSQHQKRSSVKILKKLNAVIKEVEKGKELR